MLAQHEIPLNFLRGGSLWVPLRVVVDAAGSALHFECLFVFLGVRNSVLIGRVGKYIVWCWATLSNIIMQ